MTGEVWGAELAALDNAGRVGIAAALSAVMGDVQAVGKGGRNESQGFNFRGVDAVVNAVGPALRRHGVIVLPRVLSSAYDTYNTRSGALMHQCILEVEFTFVGPAGDLLVCSAMGESADSGDKATAKAHSVAFRTALLQALCIPTDDPDPDQTSVERAPARPADRISPEYHAAIVKRIKALPDDVREAIRPLVEAGPDLRELTEAQTFEADAFLDLVESADG